MTIDSTAAVDMDVDRIVRRAMQLAGLMTPQQGPDDPAWIAQSGMARDFLEADAEHLQSVGIMQRNVEFYDVDIVAGTATYALPSSTLDVLGVAMFAADDEDGQAPVNPMDRDRYVRITDKTATGQPTLYYPHKSASVTLYMWPVPIEDGTLQVQRYKAVASSTTGTSTMDFERSWTQYFVYSLAHQLSMSKGVAVDRLSYFRKEADRCLERCKASSARQFAPRRLILAHRSGHQ